VEGGERKGSGIEEGTPPYREKHPVLLAQPGKSRGGRGFAQISLLITSREEEGVKEGAEGIEGKT